MKRILIIPFTVGRTNHDLIANPACNESRLYIVPMEEQASTHWPTAVNAICRSVSESVCGREVEMLQLIKTEQTRFWHSSNLHINHAFTSLLTRWSKGKWSFIKWIVLSFIEWTVLKGIIKNFCLVYLYLINIVNIMKSYIYIYIAYIYIT